MKWQPEEDVRLIKLWNQGVCAKDIGRILSRNKNAVIGRITRLRSKHGLEKRLTEKYSDEPAWLTKRKLTIIERIVNAVTGISPQQIQSDNGNHPVVVARILFYELAKANTRASRATICKKMGRGSCWPQYWTQARRDMQLSRAKLDAAQAQYEAMLNPDRPKPAHVVPKTEHICVMDGCRSNRNPGSVYCARHHTQFVVRPDSRVRGWNGVCG